jgi:hypothetical protein
MSPDSLAVAWYREAQWSRLRALAADQNNLDPTFAGWRFTAERMCAEMEAFGHRVRRIEVDVEMLWAWCCAQGRPLDGAARAEYVTRLAQQMGADPGAE